MKSVKVKVKTVSMDIPSFLQDTHATTCGIVCSQMLFTFFGVQTKYKKLVQEIPHAERSGMFGWDVGRLFLKRGFSCEVVYHDEEIMSHALLRDMAGKDKHVVHKKLIRKTSRSFAKHGTPLKKYMRYTMDEYCALGGILTPRPVTADDIRSALRNKTGVILGVRRKHLMGSTDKSTGEHAVVPVKMNATTIWINDPLSGVHAYPIDDLLFACHRSDAMGIFVRPRTGP